MTHEALKACFPKPMRPWPIIHPNHAPSVQKRSQATAGHILLWFLCLLLTGLTACAPTLPQETALDYWKKRTSLDLSCTDYVEKRFQKEALDDFVGHRVAMKALHPNLERYKFDFSRVEVKLEKLGDDYARVAVWGKVAVMDSPTNYLEEGEVNDRLDLKLEDWDWRIDYRWKLDYLAQIALTSLAAAQEQYVARNDRYASALNALTQWYSPDPALDVAITFADKKSWSGRARHKDSATMYFYDSAAGGLRPTSRKPGP